MDKQAIISQPGTDAISARFSCTQLEVNFLEYLQSIGRSKNGIWNWCLDFQIFKKWNIDCNDISDLSDIHAETIEAYKEWLIDLAHKNHRSIARLVRCVSRFVAWKDHTGGLIGKRFGAVVVLGKDPYAKKGGGFHTKWLCKCDVCGQIKSMRGSDLRTREIIDCGCTANFRMGSKLAKTDIMIGSKFGHLIVIRRDEAKEHGCGVHVFWICRCDLCGREESISAHRLRGSFEVKDRCSYCVKKSLGEAKIRELLDNAQISYKTEQTFDGCVNPATNYKLRFDFDIAATKTSPEYLIEFDGEQHFHVAPMWDDTDSLAGRQMKDQIKTDWCAQNNMPLIRIPYTHLRQLCLADLILSQSQFVVTPQSLS